MSLWYGIYNQQPLKLSQTSKKCNTRALRNTSSWSVRDANAQAYKNLCVFFKFRGCPQVPPPNCPLLTNVGHDHVVSEELRAAGVTQANGLVDASGAHRSIINYLLPRQPPQSRWDNHGSSSAAAVPHFPQSKTRVSP